jgi:hypothetical protein
MRFKKNLYADVDEELYKNFVNMRKKMRKFVHTILNQKH